MSITIRAHSDDELTSLNETIASVDNVHLSSVLGVRSTRLPQVVVDTEERTVVRVVEEGCRPGFWCTAGYSIPCSRGHYNPQANADNAGACEACPPFSTTRDENSTSIDDCLCNTGYYNDQADGDDVSCKQCFLLTSILTQPTE